MSEESREELKASTPAENSADRASEPEASPEEPPAPMQPPETAAIDLEPEVPPVNQIPEQAVSGKPHSTNGHTPVGKLVVETNGIILREGAIVHGDRSIDISEMELRALTVILRASPNPVGVPFIVKRAWPRINQAVAESQLTHACKRLRERLPEIGLRLHSEKGVGIAIGVAA